MPQVAPSFSWSLSIEPGPWQVLSVYVILRTEYLAIRIQHTRVLARRRLDIVEYGHGQGFNEAGIVSSSELVVRHALRRLSLSQARRDVMVPILSKER